METAPIVLASASPRRRRLIAWLGVQVAITATDTPEDLSAPLPPARLAATLAADKARAARAIGACTGTILAFDTIVVADGQVLGKPADRDDARRMLALLSGETHEVVTGVALYAAGMAEPATFAVSTPVAMRALEETTVDAWVVGDEVLGCAGAYNIERHLASVDDDQCFQNVAGLPLCHVYAALVSGIAGVAPSGLTAPVDRCDATLDRRCTLGPRVCGSAS
jgi:septum formation protein